VTESALAGVNGQAGLDCFTAVLMVTYFLCLQQSWHQEQGKHKQ
jgi:hypothetical protein